MILIVGPGLTKFYRQMRFVCRKPSRVTITGNTILMKKAPGKSNQGPFLYYMLNRFTLKGLYYLSCYTSARLNKWL